MPRTKLDVLNTVKIKEIKQLKEDGLTNVEVAEKLNITVRTLYNWAKENEDLYRAITLDPYIQEQLVSESLFKRAMGYKRVIQTPLKVRVPIEPEWIDDPDEKPKKKNFVATEEIIKVVETIEEVPADVNAIIFLLMNMDNIKWRKKDRQLQQTLNDVKIMLERKELPPLLAGEISEEDLLAYASEEESESTEQNDLPP
ncbi:MAG: hypothetical protein FWG64_09995 [Firmicutes bacterium]|nr:hypothetical protein [Bacillota bacterium]